MQLTNTWRRRLTTAGHGSAKAIVAILVASAAIMEMAEKVVVLL